MTTTLIASASYVEAELAAEFGHLPTAFLPIGHRRLYDLQGELLGPGTHISLPASFNVPAADQDRLDRAGITVVRVPDGLRLGESILYALEMIGAPTGAVRLLHGDTIIYDLPAGEDVVAVGDAPDSYEWGAVPAAQDGVPPEPVLSGYFAFADIIVLRRALATARGDFLVALGDYGRERPLAQRKVISWLDFGHLQTYYRSRCSIRIQRAFNDMSISYRVVEKRSQNGEKLAAEAAWYDTLPPALRLYTPAFLGLSRAPDEPLSYKIEYLPIPSLHELFVFGTLGEANWRQIVGSCFDFMESCLEHAPAAAVPGALRELTTDKTAARLDDFFAASGISPTREWKYQGRTMPALHRVAELAGEAIDLDACGFGGVMHGDLCFTNIFYDFRTCRIRVIDPRGMIGGQQGIGGDVRYDMAKLWHSIHGAYDFILADRYRCAGFDEGDLHLSFPADSSFDTVNRVARELSLKGRRLGDAENTAVTIHLFLSMLPLHADNPRRQRAFVANALRLFSEGLAK